MNIKVLCYAVTLVSSNVLIDTDIGADDALGLLMAFAQANIHAITLTHGNVKLDTVVRNMFTLLHTLDLQSHALGSDLYNKSTPRIAVGASQPLDGPGYDPMGDDGLGGVTESHPELVDPFWQTRLNVNRTAHFRANTTSRFIASHLIAADEIIHQLKRAPHKSLTIIALGPLTNIALAIRKNPTAVSRVKRIVVMGGAINVPGNMNSYAEFNMLVDPLAADIVFQATLSLPIHVILVPLDVTHSTQLTADALNPHLKHISQTPLATFSHAILSREFRSPAHPNQAEMFDPLAVAIALDLVTPSKAPYLNLRVEHTNSTTLGHCYINSARSANVQVVLTIGRASTFPNSFLVRTFPAPSKNKSD
ncbi:hypothetical protein DSO57_1015157 [Entomophthora muscae]|uniref:Uncharacterized protein n=1 Tax=Entomophthora muscae TaxID=34485 RepID=A0ACC2USE1_9FUNG|nr:hypothetical protein DSO57_1015157 [Entomophthora muscae]